MRKPEQRLWDRMRKRLSGSGIWFQRIENGVGAGRPDLDALCKGTFTPVELKQVDGWPTRETTPVVGAARGLNRDQLNWWLEWNKREGPPGIIIVGVGSKEVFGFDGSWSEYINQLNTEEFKAKARLLNWREIEHHLKGYKV